MAHKSKYKAQKVTLDGITFDSKKEAARYSELKLLERVGAISNLELQKEFLLIPTQREPDTIGARGAVKKGKVIEKSVRYIADFTYTDNETGELVVEDTKGFKIANYIIKRKLMLQIHGIRIKEI